MNGSRIKIIDFPLYPVSLNMAYPTGANGRRFMSKRGKDFKNQIVMIAKSQLKNFLFRKDEEYLEIEYHFFVDNLFLKDQSKLRKSGRPDTSNCIKLVEDALCTALGIDDYLCLDGSFTMNFSNEPKIKVIIRAESLHHKISKFNEV